jgi:hypothetical protein
MNQRRKDVEETLGLLYKKLSALERELLLSAGPTITFELQHRIDNEIKPQIARYKTELNSLQSEPTSSRSTMPPEPNLLNLSGQDKRRLRESVLAAYPSSGDLQMFVEEYLDENLAAIAGGDNLNHVVFHLIRWAIAKGHIETLILSLYEDTKNPEIRSFCKPVIQQHLKLNTNSNPSHLLNHEFAWDGDIEDEELQAFLPIQYSLEADVGQLLQGLNWGKSVCRITHINRPSESATGVLIAPNLVLTNYHVLSLQETEDLAAIAQSLRFEFGYISSQGVHPVSSPASTVVPHQPVIHASPVPQLDYVLLQVDTDGVTLQPVPWRPQSPLSPKSSLNILQHPDGERMKVSLSNNGVVKVDSVRGLVWYVNRTQGGSSGSPCFNEDWELVALHHKEQQRSFGSVREGILFQSIYAKIFQYLS